MKSKIFWISQVSLGKNLIWNKYTLCWLVYSIKKYASWNIHPFIHIYVKHVTSVHLKCVAWTLLRVPDRSWGIHIHIINHNIGETNAFIGYMWWKLYSLPAKLRITFWGNFLWELRELKSSSQYLEVLCIQLQCEPKKIAFKKNI